MNPTPTELTTLFENRNLFMGLISLILLENDVMGPGITPAQIRSDKFDDLAHISFSQEYSRLMSLFGKHLGDIYLHNNAPEKWIELAWRQGYIELAAEAKRLLDACQSSTSHPD